MASIVEKYEQIFASDPKSRIFVELARALLERGDAARALDVCRRGLDHHPSSILGRVIWGRALLEQSDRKAALDQFEIAIALDPGSPYAYNLVGEALLAKDLARDALPVLARAAELQPADERVRAWYDEARRRATAKPPPRSPRAGDEERTEPYRPLPTPASADGEPSDGIADDPFALASARTDPAGAAVGPGEASGEPDDSDDSDAVTDAGMPLFAPAAGAPSEPARPPPLRAATPAPPAPPAPPPLPPPPSLLDLIPGDSAPARRMTGVHKPPPMPEQRAAQEAEAERIAASYAEEVRKRMLATVAPRSAAAGRGKVVAAVVLAVAVLAAGGVFAAVTSARSAELSRTALTRARAGLARDTVGSLREAHALLAGARKHMPDDPGLLSLAAQVAALLGVEYGDPAALTLARELVTAGGAGDGGIAARLVLARAGTELAAAEAAVLEARPSGPPLLQTLAGELLLARGEVDAGRGRLEIAARASPPTLRALADLGDSALAGGDAEAALDYYGPALQAHATHPRSVVGAAEARLALGRDLEQARKDLEAVAADPASAPPASLRPRFEVTFARVLTALGDSPAATTRLAAAAQALGDSAALAAAQAEVHLAARAWDRAEAAAARAVAADPKSLASRVLLARARIGYGKLPEALQALSGRQERPARIQRAISLHRMGRHLEARSELEKTVRDGRMPAEAAVWYGLADVSLGRADRARQLLERLAAGSSPPPLASVALGRACDALLDAACAEKAYRDAVRRDPRAPEGYAGLGRLLAARGDLPGALDALSAAVKLDPSDLTVRRTLGEVRLASGQPAAARAELDTVLLAHPADPDALALVSAAWLAEGQPAEARRAAERAVAAAPRSPVALLAAAKAALAAGDRASARSYAGRASRAGARGDEASRVLAESSAPGAAKPARPAKKKK